MMGSDGAERANVLVADDRSANVLAIQQVLEPLDHNVVTASSGEEVLVVGGGQEAGDVDPETELRALYECTDTVDTEQVAGLDAASCTTPDRHATIVASEGTTVRFAFAATVPQPSRDEVLATLTIG